MADYDCFARAYDRFWAESFLQRSLPAIERLALRDLRPGARVLDVACGSGRLLAELTRRGFEAVGLDIAPEMIDLARAAAPEATSFVADMRDFTIDEEFDAVLCLYDSLNHLRTREDLEASLRSVRAALRQGGVFLADVNTAEAFRSSWDGSFSIVGDDMIVIATAATVGDGTAASMELVVLTRSEDSSWRRADTVIEERAWSDETWLGCLSDAGFPHAEMLTAASVGVDSEGRKFILAS